MTNVTAVDAHRTAFLVGAFSRACGFHPAVLDESRLKQLQRQRLVKGVWFEHSCLSVKTSLYKQLAQKMARQCLPSHVRHPTNSSFTTSFIVVKIRVNLKQLCSFKTFFHLKPIFIRNLCLFETVVHWRPSLRSLMVLAVLGCISTEELHR